MYNIKDILDGHTNEMLGLNKDIAKERLKICAKCPIMKKTVVGPVCNSKMWIDPKTGNTSTTKKDGYVNGCGCRLTAKTTLSYAECPINKW